MVSALAAGQRGHEGAIDTPGLVVCASGPACEIGATVLSRGGNAMDAAVATSFALAVTHPAAGNIGGGGFMVVRTREGDALAFDYRETAPLASTPGMYLDADGQIDRSLTRAGYLAAGVPGSVRGLDAAHRRLGRLPWKDLVLPAATLAETGFVLSDALAASLNAELVLMAPFAASLAAYGKPGGGPWLAGDRIVLTDLGRTLRSIATDGAEVFYSGWVADRIAAAMREEGGLITREDLAAYRARERPVVRGTYGRFEIVSMPPPSSGGVALVEMLNILEPFALRSHGLLAAPALHLQAEAMRRAYLDRARYLGDPDFSDVPVDRLVSKAHARAVAATIERGRASSSAALGRDLLPGATAAEPESTTHVSVVDRDGMAVATTTTLEGSYGAHAVVPGTGFLLNNEMGDFNRRPGVTDAAGEIGTPPNTIAPGKRMLSNMTPTIVSRGGRLVLVTGSPGGRTIINTVLAVVLGVVEYGLSGAEAVARPRMHHQWMPDRLAVEAAMPETSVRGLEALGHRVTTVARQGDAHTIWVDAAGRAHGVPDPRTPDSRASVAGGRLTAAQGRQ